MVADDTGEGSSASMAARPGASEQRVLRFGCAVLGLAVLGYVACDGDDDDDPAPDAAAQMFCAPIPVTDSSPPDASRDFCPTVPVGEDCPEGCQPVA